MAACLGCGSRHARVVCARSAVVVEEGDDVVVVSRITRRTVRCPPPPLGCGETRYQRIEDEGRATKIRPEWARDGTRG